MKNENFTVKANKNLSQLLTVSAWIFGLIAIVSAVFFVSFRHYISAFLAFVASSVMFPPIYRFINIRMNLSLSKGARSFCLILLFGLAIFFLS